MTRRGRGLLLAAGIGIASVLTVSPVLAMGFGGSDAPPARIPIPARDFAATVEDQSGMRISVTQVSYNGEVYLYGHFGEGQVTVPFEQIKEVRFEPGSDQTERLAFVSLRDGQSVRVTVDYDIPAYGKTSFGTYSIPVEKIRKIEFAP